MSVSTLLAAAHPLPLLREDAWRGAEPPSLAGPVCFGRHQFASYDGARPRLRLSPAHAEALAELLPVLLCGEESAALAFDQIARSGDPQREMRAALARIALDELEHQTLLQRIRAALPPSHDDPGLSAGMRRFFMRLASRDPATHCARIAAVDAGVCLLLRALRSGCGPVATEPTLSSVVARIHRDEARHVAVTSRHAAQLAGVRSVRDDVVEVRHRLTRLLERRATSLESLGVDPDRLFRSLQAIPRVLLRGPGCLHASGAARRGRRQPTAAFRRPPGVHATRAGGDVRPAGTRVASTGTP
jgi:hypothetical protein